MNNDKEIALVVLAAGMGSRYGGLKQMDAFGPSGESIIDYSVYDAIKAGFNKIVFVIRDEFHEVFENQFRSNINNPHVEIVFVDQDLHDLPAVFSVPDDRVKPWGTGHALWACRKALSGPFAIINGDDFYGRKAFQDMYHYLSTETIHDASKYAMIAYQVQNTLSDFGSVSRGVCEVCDEGNLIKVTERTKIERYTDGRIYFWESDYDRTFLPDTAPVSMNLWGMHAEAFDHIESSFSSFLKERGRELKSEYYLPTIITELLNSGKISVKTIVTDEPWFGVTYPDDKEQVKGTIAGLIEKGRYSEELWGRDSL